MKIDIFKVCAGLIIVLVLIMSMGTATETQWRHSGFECWGYDINMSNLNISNVQYLDTDYISVGVAPENITKSYTATVGKSGAVDYLTTDYGSDDLCIQAAIDYVNGLGGGKILVREGEYIFTNGINITSSFIDLEFLPGAYITNNQNDYAINITQGTRSHSHNKLMNIKIECNNTLYPTSKGINIDKACSICIYNVYMSNLFEGITLTETNTNRIRDGRIYGHTQGTGVGVRFSDENAGETVVDGLTFTKLKDGILCNDTTLYKNDGIKILNCFFYYVDNDIHLVTARGLYIAGCYLEASDKGIYIENNGTGIPRFITITGNYFTLGAVGWNVYIENRVRDVSVTYNFDKTASHNDFHISSNAENITYISFKPVGHFTAPSVPATTVNYKNKYGYPCQVQVTGGTVTEIDIDDIATGLTSGIFIIPPSGTINIAYSAIPSWRWWGL